MFACFDSHYLRKTDLDKSLRRALRLSQDLKQNKDIVFLMVDVDDNYKKSQKCMEHKKFSLTVFTPATAIPESLLDSSIPTTVIFDKAGRLVYKHLGAGGFGGEKVKEYLNKLTVQ